MDAFDAMVRRLEAERAARPPEPQAPPTYFFDDEASCRRRRQELAAAIGAVDDLPSTLMAVS